MATGLGIEGVTLAIVIGVLAAIVYSLRIMMLLERRIARMDMNLLRLTEKVLQEELAIAKEEKIIEKKLGTKRAARKKTAPRRRKR